MKVRHLCRKCGTRLETGRSVTEGYRYYCPNCDEDMYEVEADDRYYPDDPKNKVYAVDTYVTVCKCVKVEAANEDEAELKAHDYVADLFRHRTDTEFIRELADEGFHDSDETEYRVSGEASEDGDIEYY